MSNATAASAELLVRLDTARIGMVQFALPQGDDQGSASFDLTLADFTRPSPNAAPL